MNIFIPAYTGLFQFLSLNMNYSFAVLPDRPRVCGMICITMNRSLHLKSPATFRPANAAALSENKILTRLEELYITQQTPCGYDVEMSIPKC